MDKTLFAIGESLIDFIPAQTGCSFEEVESFSPKIGGAPANVLGAFAKLGGATQLLTQLGDDPFGHKILNKFKEWNVGTEYVSLTDKANTALAFVSLDADGNRDFSFYRNPSADMLFDESQVKREWFDNCFGLHFCSVSLGDTPMKEAHKKAIAYAEEAGGIISFDLNLRFPLWKKKNDLKKAVLEFMPLAHIIKLSDEELEFVTGMNDIQKAKEILFKGNTQLILYTCGPQGAYAITKDACIYSEALAVKAVDTTGAGDAFCGSFLYSLYRNGIDVTNFSSLSTEQLKNYLDCSNRYCGQSVQHPGAIESYPETL